MTSWVVERSGTGISATWGVCRGDGKKAGGCGVRGKHRVVGGRAVDCRMGQGAFWSTDHSSRILIARTHHVVPAFGLHLARLGAAAWGTYVQWIAEVHCPEQLCFSLSPPLVLCLSLSSLLPVTFPLPLPVLGSGPDPPSLTLDLTGWRVPPQPHKAVARLLKRI